MYTNDDVAVFHALQPDCPDPPTQPFSGRGFPVCSARAPGGVPPGGGGGGGGGRGRGGELPPAVPAPQAALNQGDKLIGNPPFTFTGDRTKLETFMSDWKKYCRANKDTA